MPIQCTKLFAQVSVFVYYDNCIDRWILSLKLGVRHLDCACDYGNEVEVGQGINRAITEGLCTRQDLWITSKLWNTYHSPEHVKPACQKSLSDMGIEYFDLYLIHFPISQRFVPFEVRYPPEWIYDPTAENPKIELQPVPYAETWRGMEDLVTEGLVKNIGVANLVVRTHLLCIGVAGPPNVVHVRDATLCCHALCMCVLRLRASWTS